MKISYVWLQSFFEQKLPDPKEVAERLTMHSFEVEHFDVFEQDTVFSIDILPNRAHDCLSHYGIAREISALFDITIAKDPLRSPLLQWPTTDRVSVVVGDEGLCPRYSALLIENVSVGPSPDWLVARLAALGQRSINNIVDATNYVMFTIGQPLHAFDLNKLTLSGGRVEVGVRQAKAGEKLVTLDDEEHELPEGTLLIVDGGTNAPIGIAGIKGGKATGVDEKTEHILIESANFHPTHIRKSAQTLGLRTDASIRFEHAISPETTMHALREVAVLITEIAGGNEQVVIAGAVDSYPGPEEKRTIEVPINRTNRLLGTSYTAADMKEVLDRLGFAYEAQDAGFLVTVPFERLDIVVPEDVIEEIGRIAGYGTIEPAKLPSGETSTEVNKRAFYTAKARTFFIERGFSEVYTYAFVNEGAVEVANPIASDKRFLRKALAPGLRGALTLNARYADLLGVEDVRVFEIGTVFPNTDGTETIALGAGIVHPDGGKKQKASDELLAETLIALAKHLNAKDVAATPHDDVFELDFGAIIKTLPEPTAQDWSAVLKNTSAEDVRYASISPYPFVLRDIAVWVPDDVSAGDVLAVILEKGGELLAQKRLFDEYKKDGRVSYAFRLAFQSHEKTLTDDEVGLIMWNITAEMNSRDGWEVR